MLSNLETGGIPTTFPLVYFNSLLAILNARGRSCDGGNMRAYQMPRILHIRRPVDSRNVASLDVRDSTSDSMERAEFRAGDKVGPGVAYCMCNIPTQSDARLIDYVLQDNHAISMPLRAEPNTAQMK